MGRQFNEEAHKTFRVVFGFGLILGGGYLIADRVQAAYATWYSPDAIAARTQQASVEHSRAQCQERLDAQATLSTQELKMAREQAADKIGDLEADVARLRVLVKETKEQAEVACIEMRTREREELTQMHAQAMTDAEARCERRGVEAREQAEHEARTVRRDATARFLSVCAALFGADASACHSGDFLAPPVAVQVTVRKKGKNSNAD